MRNWSGTTYLPILGGPHPRIDSYFEEPIFKPRSKFESKSKIHLRGVLARDPKVNPPSYLNYQQFQEASMDQYGWS